MGDPKKKIGRPKGTRRTEPAFCYVNVPFTEEEDEALTRMSKLRGMTKRALLKKFINDGLKKHLKSAQLEPDPINNKEGLLNSLPNINIQVGSIVQLNSGGDAMTVVNLDNDCITCNWFEEIGFQEKTFPIKAIKLK